MKLRIFRLASVTALSFASAGAAHAQSYVTGTATSVVTFPDLAANPTTIDDSHSFTNTTSSTVNTPTTVSSSVPAQSGASAQSTLTGSAGVFHGFATATHPETGNSYYSEGVVSLGVSDEVLFGALLAPGTPVTEKFSIVLNGSNTTAVCGQACGGSYSAEATASALVNSPVAGTSSLDLHDGTAGTGNVLTGLITAPAGTVFDLGMEFTEMAYVNGIEYLGQHPDTATVDYSDHFYIDTLTAGAGDAIGMSGHDYASPSVVAAPVPEPAAWALFASGLLAFCAFKPRGSKGKPELPTRGVGFIST